jgi:CheY-like chemotaxis protein
MFKILIVDDDPSLRILLSRMVTKLGYTPRDAANGIQGELIAAEWHPDAIVMDIMMPGQDGCITCANLRQKGYAGHIILMSALAGGIAMAEVTRYGADTFLSKPLSLTGLQKCLSIYLPADMADSQLSAPGIAVQPI